MANANRDKSVGFVGLGNVGAKLAGSLLRNGVDLTVNDLDKKAAAPLLAVGQNGRIPLPKWPQIAKSLSPACPHP